MCSSDLLIGDTNYRVNKGLTDNYVYWAWKAGGAAVTNTSGTISSQVSANPTNGFSVVQVTSMNSGSIGHGLGVVPSMVIGRMTAETFNWHTWHTSLSGGTYNLKLNLTDAQAAQSTIWTGLPTSSVINVGSSWTVGNPAIFYCWAAIPGFSAFGSYTGNGSADGPFVFCGFRPKWVMVKDTTSTWNWWIVDSARNTYNLVNNELIPNSSGAELTGYFDVDFLSNGFKKRGTDTQTNTSGDNYIFAAFADVPFKYALAR